VDVRRECRREVCLRGVVERELGAVMASRLVDGIENPDDTTRSQLIR